MKFTTAYFLALASFAVSSVVAAPVAVRDVYVPPITCPKAGDEWVVGETRTVTWDASSPPVQITNPNGVIMLRKGDRTTNITLARDFDISLGEIEVEVPVVETAGDYALVLFGDSGNFSPQFTITAA